MLEDPEIITDRPEPAPAKFLCFVREKKRANIPWNILNWRGNQGGEAYELSSTYLQHGAKKIYAMPKADWGLLIDKFKRSKASGTGKPVGESCEYVFIELGI